MPLPEGTFTLSYARCGTSYGGCAACRAHRSAGSRSGGYGGIGTHAAGIQFALQALKVGANLGGHLVAQIFIFLEQLIKDAFEFGRHVAVELHGRNRRAMKNVAENHGAGGTGKRQRARDRLIENRAEGKQIAARVERLTTSLLGRHVSDRADCGAGAGKKSVMRRGNRLAFDRAFGFQQLRQAEIQDLGVAAIGDEDIRGLDVPMDDAFFVRGIQSVGQLHAESDCARNRHWPARQNFLERLAFEEFHSDEGSAFVFLDRMDDADAGMVQGGGGTCFAKEAFHCGRIFEAAVLQELQSDAAPQLRIFGFIDESHAATA